jgi:two-component system sensor histidine kinase/response regulator
MSLTTDEAASGEEGIEMVNSAVKSGKPYDVVFIDWQMPGLDGIETGNRILALPNLITQPYLVLVTAYGREEVLSMAEKSGFESILIKPVTSSTLFETMVASFGGSIKTFGEERPAGPDLDVARLRGTRVLLVEDNEINREVALGHLSDAELIVDVAENGAVAVQMVQQNDYDGVLMDVQMPVMDGLEATRMIRSDPGLQNLPIIAMTASALASDREACQQAGMNDHVAKPVEPDQLFGALNRWVKRPEGADNGPAKASQRYSAEDKSDRVLPEIAGIDTIVGLKRTGGNSKRYERLLRSFAQQQADVITGISEALLSGDSVTAERTAHSLKGAAGTLGAVALAELAAKVETALKSGQEPQAFLAALSDSVKSVVDAIGGALPDESVAVDTSSDPGKDYATVGTLLGRLKQLLENDDGEAADFIADAEPSLSGILTAAEVQTLRKLVEDFDFDASLNCLARIADRLGLNLQSS